MVNKITDFGYNFQIKLIVGLMTQPKFMEQIHDILDEKHFDNEAIKWIVKECKNYYLKYKKSPTLNVFKMTVSEIKNDILNNINSNTIFFE